MACSAGARKEFSQCWPVSLTRSVSAIGSCSTSWIVWSKRRSESCGERLISYVRAVGNLSGIGGGGRPKCVCVGGGGRCLGFFGGANQKHLRRGATGKAIFHIPPAPAA